MSTYYSNQQDSEGDSSTAVISREDIKLQRPKMFRVLLHNDDYTPMDFVTHVLEKYFRKSAAEAEKIMLDVHRKGIGLCGVYPFDIAETKVSQVTRLAESHEYPLKCTCEEDRND